ncbi:MAG: hypothetical protein KC800_08955 [Candidatus Eremiobacteraeota bacterium]|nr:hypothetical protein [Candidatus Eremiobacteraeota bacterium]
MTNVPVDVVYTWVDWNDVEYQKVCARYAGEPEDLNPERFRDPFNFMKYSLRSLEMYAPWVRNVYLFTRRPQAPDWINLEHPRLKLVHHDQLFDDPEYLPTFNCNVIESFFHRMPSAQHLMYMNDDFLFGRPTEKTDFLTADGRVRLMGTLFGERMAFRNREKSKLSLGLIEHTPILMYLPYWQAMLEELPELVHETRTHRFRQDDDLKMDKLYRIYLAGPVRDRVEVVPIYELLRYHRFHKITNKYWWQKLQVAYLRWLQPKFYCLNDDMRDDPDPRVVSLVQQFLKDSYPNPSSFEKAQ